MSKKYPSVWMSIQNRNGSRRTTGDRLVCSVCVQLVGIGQAKGWKMFQVSVKQAAVASASHPLVFLSFQAHGTWIYALSYHAQQQIKSLIASKAKAAALHLLLALPGMQQVAVAWGDNSKLPKNVNNIHLQISRHNS
jgi:hypothetical protein